MKPKEITCFTISNILEEKRNLYVTIGEVNEMQALR